jgi:hypothetical protein
VESFFKAKSTLFEAAKLEDGVGGDLGTEGLAL